MVIDRDGRRHGSVILLIIGLTLGAEGLKTPDDIARQNRGAVREPRFRPEGEGHAATIGGDAHAFGQQAIGGSGFILGLAKQRIPNIVRTGGGRATDDEGVEAVETADLAEGDGAALGGAGVGIGEGLEIGRQRGRPDDTDAVAAFRHRLGTGEPGRRQ